MTPRVYPPRRPHVGYREDEAVLAAIDSAVEQGKFRDRSEAIRAATMTVYGVVDGETLAKRWGVQKEALEAAVMMAQEFSD